MAGLAESWLVVAVLSPVYFDSTRSVWPQLEGVTAHTHMGGREVVYPVFTGGDHRAYTASGVLIKGQRDRHGRPLCAGALLSGSLGSPLAAGCVVPDTALALKVVGDLVATNCG